MDNFKKKLQYFLDNKCIGDWGNCPACPEYKEGSCHHPDHPSMQEVKMESPARVNPCLSKAMHDIRNTYNSLIYHFDGELEFSVNPEEAVKRMYQDLELMAMAERACKACKEAQNV